MAKYTVALMLVALNITTASAEEAEVTRTIRETSPDGTGSVVVQQKRSAKVEQETHRGSNANKFEDCEMTVTEKGTDVYNYFQSSASRSVQFSIFYYQHPICRLKVLTPKILLD